MGTNNIILVVEDDPQTAQLLSMMLLRKGFEALVVEDGSEALEVLDQFEPILIILDMQLPTINGWEFLAHYYNTHSESTVPIIGTSAGAVVPHSIKGLTAYLPKPFGLADLMNTIEAVLSQSEPTPGNAY